MLTLHGPWLPGLPAGTGGGMGQPGAKTPLNFCLHGVGGLGTPQSTPHLSSCVCTSLDTSSGGVCDSESPIMFLLVWLGFVCQGVSLHLGATRAKGSYGGAGARGIPRRVPSPSCRGQTEECPEPGGSAPWAAALGAELLPSGDCQGRR